MTLPYSRNPSPFLKPLFNLERFVADSSNMVWYRLIQGSHMRQFSLTLHYMFPILTYNLKHEKKNTNINVD